MGSVVFSKGNDGGVFSYIRSGGDGTRWTIDAATGPDADPERPLRLILGGVADPSAPEIVLGIDEAADLYVALRNAIDVVRQA